MNFIELDVWSGKNKLDKTSMFWVHITVLFAEVREGVKQVWWGEMTRRLGQC